MNPARIIRGVLTAIYLLTMAAPTLAQPANDTFANRRALGSVDLPFTDAVDTTEATTDADDAELFSLSDVILEADAPYYYQAATELGGPRFDERRLHGLLNYAREDVPANYPPLEVDKDFDRALMRQVERWVKTSGERMIFLYGVNDPWSATAFDVKRRNDSYRLFVTGEAGDHSASLDDLPPAAFGFALKKLESWLEIGTDAGALRTSSAVTPRIDRPTRRELFLR